MPWRLAAAFWALALAVGSLAPGSAIPATNLKQLVLHFLGYWLFGHLLLRALETREPLVIQSKSLQAFLLASLYGGALEILQAFAPERAPALEDAAANALGALAACLAWPLAAPPASRTPSP